IAQDEDCLDTWFSSWLWPFEVFKGYSKPDNKDVKYYYPTNTLVTAPEIIFFWVARMIMAGFEYKGGKPFSEVYFTGIVRDKQGRKMSKQLGNSPDLLQMIEDDGADAVRFGIMISSPAGNDLMWDQAGNEQGRFFINKMWNALKLVKMWEGRLPIAIGTSANSQFAVKWFESRLAEVRLQLDEQFKDFKLSEALKTIYSLIWDDFCSWYLEWVKPGFEQPIDRAVYEKTVDFFEQLMQILHPFMPFITEEIYHELKAQKDDITVKPYPAPAAIDKSILQNGSLLKETITAIRDARNKNQLKPKDTINLFIDSKVPANYKIFDFILTKQVNADQINYVTETVANSITIVINNDKIYIKSDSDSIDNNLRNEIVKDLLQKDLDYQKGFLASVEKKLNNERFVNNAKPEIIELERKKKEDTEAKIKTIQESLASL
ncbi:MAG: class I tRNA ligase family protein, partial [Chitinophagaceae bacterium]